MHNKLFGLGDAIFEKSQMPHYKDTDYIDLGHTKYPIANISRIIMDTLCSNLGLDEQIIFSYFRLLEPFMSMPEEFWSWPKIEKALHIFIHDLDFKSANKMYRLKHHMTVISSYKRCFIDSKRYTNMFCASVCLSGYTIGHLHAEFYSNDVGLTMAKSPTVL